MNESRQEEGPASVPPGSAPEPGPQRVPETVPDGIPGVVPGPVPARVQDEVPDPGPDMDQGAGLDSRADILDRLRSCLEELGDALGDPADLEDEDEAPDLFTLLAELAALKNEVRIESRQVKAALDEFSAVFDTLRGNAGRLQEQMDRQHERAGAERREGEQALFLELLDLRDRLAAGEEQASRYAPGWLARRGGAGAFVSGMAEGMALNLRHLDELLARRGVRRLEALHRPFDPHTMRAVATDWDAARAEGVVLGVARAGYLRDGRVLRLAEVIVNKENRAS
jgi:molecular chaperone GrpE